MDDDKFIDTQLLEPDFSWDPGLPLLVVTMAACWLPVIIPCLLLSRKSSLVLRLAPLISCIVQGQPLGFTAPACTGWPNLDVFEGVVEMVRVCNATFCGCQESFDACCYAHYKMLCLVAWTCVVGAQLLSLVSAAALACL